MPGDISWQLSATEAKLTCGPLRASFNARSPASGLREVSYDGAPLTGSSFLGLDINVGQAAIVSEFYQRGRDLILRYAQTAERVFAVVAYWRAGLLEIAGKRHPHVDLIVSIETSLLDSRPSLAAKSFLANAEHKVVSCPASYLLGRFASPRGAYAEMCHPDDAISPLIATTASGIELTTWLFGQPLEKGVILRSRLRGLFAPNQDDEPIAEAALAEFAAAAPPLTT